MICKITETMKELGYSIHTGFTFAWTMRNMEYLAKHGKIAYLKTL